MGVDPLLDFACNHCILIIWNNMWLLIELTEYAEMAWLSRLQARAEIGVGGTDVEADGTDQTSIATKLVGLTKQVLLQR